MAHSVKRMAERDLLGQSETLKVTRRLSWCGTMGLLLIIVAVVLGLMMLEFLTWHLLELDIRQSGERIFTDHVEMILGSFIEGFVATFILNNTKNYRSWFLCFGRAT